MPRLPLTRTNFCLNATSAPRPGRRMRRINDCLKRSKTMRRKLWILGATLSLLAATPAGAIKVYKTTSEGLADVKVYVTKSEGLADCIIYVENSRRLADGNAKWYFENSAGLADVKVYFTESEGLADKKIYFTNSRGLAKCDVDWKSYKK